jgi:hypothetical protein
VQQQARNFTSSDVVNRGVQELRKRFHILERSAGALQGNKLHQLVVRSGSRETGRVLPHIQVLI